ncbi:hypothetical protein [Solemya elarraichensis gill symbiont]|uniref:Peptidoglycan-binding protein n=1 Tax=Solemya elarraichensis gill symbiont TaxID=1918949 RepID=A0A1T2LCK6_9GAMM|nr:hypothetical protein [Solemya elarraichensis gill symbiont]OOZ42823.1 hypothetical protein BOW52_01355 [Solemya elarraichensis gill symbiont]
MHHDIIRTITSLSLLAAVLTFSCATAADSGASMRPVTTPKTPHMHFNQLKAFVPKLHLLQEDQIEELPYIVGIEEDTLMATTGDLIYVRGLNSYRGRKYDIIRPDDSYHDHDTGELLGISGTHIGTAVNLGGDDPKTMRIESIQVEARRGDLLIPARKPAHAKGVGHPKAPKLRVAGHVIDTINGVIRASHYEVVVIDRGSRDGLKPGDILAVNSSSRQVVDQYAKPPPLPTSGDPISPQVIYTPHNEFLESYEGQQGNMGGINVDTAVEVVSLPQESIGHVLVFQTHERVSFAMITNASRSILVGNLVTN